MTERIKRVEKIIYEELIIQSKHHASVSVSITEEERQMETAKEIIKRLFPLDV